MASSKEYLEYVLETLREVSGITFRKMMGEYVIYKDGVVFGGIYDERFLIKKTTSVTKEGLTEEIPYEGAKPMLLIDTEDPHEVARLVGLVADDLKH